MSGINEFIDAAGVEAIPIVSEEINVDKRTVERRRVRIIKAVSERTEIAAALLHEDSVEVTRRPIGRTVEHAPDIREEGDLLIIPVLEEILVVETRLVLKEEIVIRRTRTVEKFEQPIVLRSEDVEILDLKPDTSEERS